VLIFANGVLPSLEAARRILDPAGLVICADGGARHARALGLRPDVLIGDLDSVTESDLGGLTSGPTLVERHPRDKDQTDLELALNYALKQDPSAIVIVGALGGRLDHMLGSIALLSDARLAARDCSLDDGAERVQLCRSDLEIRGIRGDLVSLIPWGGPASGVSTEGLRWALMGETLTPEQSRGISNEMLGDHAHVHVGRGALIVIQRRVQWSATL